MAKKKLKCTGDLACAGKAAYPLDDTRPNVRACVAKSGAWECTMSVAHTGDHAAHGACNVHPYKIWPRKD